MREAVVITDWYVVPEQIASTRHPPLARAQQAKRVDGLGSATAGPLWAWADSRTPSAPRWQGLHALSSPGTSYLFELTKPVGGQAHGATAPAAAASPVVLRMPRIVLCAMSLAASVTGRDEREVWAEAASEWLARHLEDDPEPPEPGASAPARHPERATRRHSWAAIDVLLRDLRAPLPETEDEPAA